MNLTYSFRKNNELTDSCKTAMVCGQKHAAKALAQLHALARH
jgi:hypothetical protein